MILTNGQKQAIKEEFEIWKNKMYSSKSLTDRKQLDQFFTPPELTIQMIEKFDNLNDFIVDPTVGAGNLLSGCILSGANPKKCFGIEIDSIVLNIAIERLHQLGVPKQNLILGNILEKETIKKLDILIKK